MKIRKLLFIALLVFLGKKYLTAETIIRKNYESKKHRVQINAMENEERLNQKLNLVEVAVYDKDDGDFWYLWYIIDGDYYYLRDQFDNNPELNVSYSYLSEITDTDIDQFAFEKKKEIVDMKYSMNKDFYTEVPHEGRGTSYFAYTRTAKDTVKMRGKLMK